MRPSIYIESSIISYLASRPSRDVIVAGRQAITHDWWSSRRDGFDLRISGLVEEEIGRGDDDAAQRRMGWVAGISSLGISEQAIELAEKLLAEGAIPAGSEEDSLHIAIAGVVESLGLACPQICSPEELGGDSDD